MAMCNGLEGDGKREGSNGRSGYLRFGLKLGPQWKAVEGHRTPKHFADTTALLLLNLSSGPADIYGA